VEEGGETRTFTDTEQAAMVAALDQFMAGVKRGRV
jgi:hypothetical protein